MKVRSAGIFFIFLLLLTNLSVRDSAAQDMVYDNSKVLAVVPVAKGSIDQDVYRQFDNLVPELKKISKSNIIKLECRYSGQSEREEDVLKAYQLAGHIEKYLREQHKLGLDLWITINLVQKKSKTLPALSIAVFADDIKRLNTPGPDKQNN